MDKEVELVEFEAAFVIDGETQYEDNGDMIFDTYQGVIVNWGTKPIETENGVAQVSVVHVREVESGKVIELYPEEIKYL